MSEIRNIQAGTLYSGGKNYRNKDALSYLFRNHYSRIRNIVTLIIPLLLLMMLYSATWIYTLQFLGIALLLFITSGLCLLIGLVWLIIAFVKKKRKRVAVVILSVPMYVFTALILTAILAFSQQEGNERRGQEIVRTVVAFHTNKGRYPYSLGELQPEYLKRVPTYWTGLLPRRFRYEMIEGEGRTPYLWFNNSPFTHCSYDFEKECWMGYSND